MNDKEIIEQFFLRNEKALTEISKNYGGYCYTIAVNILGNKEDSEEALNDTWLTAWKLIPPNEPQCLRAFLGKITRNISLNKYAKSRRIKRGGPEVELIFDEIDGLLSDNKSLEDEFIRKQVIAEINRFLSSLPKRDCNIFLCRYYYMMPIKDIAKRCGESEKYIGTLLSRTRRKIKKYLKEIEFYD